MTSPGSPGGGIATADQVQQSTTRCRRGPRPALMVALGVMVLIAGAFAFLANRHHDQQSQLIRVSGIPSSVSTPLATLMALSPVPAKPAPDFTLTDQNGRTHSLSSFRGRAVVLEFMDTHCTDICPIISQEFIDAYRQLGTAASRVVFAAVNVNGYHAAVSDVASFSQEHQLNTIPNWHFFTGRVSDLHSVWSNYGIVVQAPSPTADVIHSSFTFFIDPNGNERYLANPTDDHTSSGTAYLPAGPLASWGQGIALVARSLIG
jgi:cytochrome oxidase Cu insertion factor (SCO1/SenC/PrrC family)